MSNWLFLASSLAGLVAKQFDWLSFALMNAAEVMRAGGEPKAKRNRYVEAVAESIHRAAQQRPSVN